MSERDLYLMFLPQIAALIVSCQQMDHERIEEGNNGINTR